MMPDENVANFNLDHFVKNFYLTMNFKAKIDPYVLGSYLFMCSK